MKQSVSSSKIAIWLSWLIAAILVLLPFHGFLSVWLSSFLGHYTLLRLWKEFLLVVLLAGVAYILLTDRRLLKRLVSLRLIQLILVYFIVILVAAFIPLIRHDVASKAVWYGVLVDLRFLAFFLVAMVVAAKSNWLAGSWPKILFAPAALVGAFAILQYLVLPYDFLKHFGYNASTIFPYETINHNIHHLRVASTLRGANPLGAYLIVPICALAVFFLKDGRQRLSKTIFGLGLLLALAFSFSRSAWIGAALGLLIVVAFCLRFEKAKKLIGWGLGATLILGAILGIALRNNTAFQDVFLHTERHSKIVTNSNEAHLSSFKTAASDIVNQPLGRGVGAAGPQSIYNHNRGRIAENYFLQIGQEAGVVGMLLFIFICLETGRLLFLRRVDPLSLALLASLIGITFVNLLSHAWVDDTLSYIWWGLAGLALAPSLLRSKNT